MMWLDMQTPTFCKCSSGRGSTNCSKVDKVSRGGYKGLDIGGRLEENDSLAYIQASDMEVVKRKATYQ